MGNDHCYQVCYAILGNLLSPLLLLAPLNMFKGKCYGSDPVVISLQLTHFQSLISLRMNHEINKT